MISEKSLNMYGYHNRVAIINLTDGSVTEEKLDPKDAADFIGGMGLGAWRIYHDLEPGLNPLGEDNELIFLVGPLTGTIAPCSGGATLVTKSPLTGGFLNSYMQGQFGVELRRSGYDMLVVKGKASHPSYLLIDNGEVQIKNAQDYWGMSTSAAGTAIQKELDDLKVKVASIGPAGEKLVLYSSILCDTRAFGRGGSGAVMGSKNLKALAVRGSMDIKIHDREKFKDAVREAVIVVREGMKAGILELFVNFGTVGGLDLINEIGVLPTRNFSTGVFEGAKKINGEALKKSLYIKKYGCYRCPIQCSRISRIKTGPHRGILIDGPEYETVGLMGSNLGIDDANTIAMANYLCDEYGLDTMSTGGTIGFAMECYEKGLLTDKETNGIKLDFGNTGSVLRVIELIGRREGVGGLLAAGVKRLSETIRNGSETFAMHIKGMEMPSWVARGLKGSALSFAVNTRGGCHKRGIMGPELLGFMDRDSVKGKGAIIKDNRDAINLYFSIGMCRFPTFVLPLEIVGDLLQSLTGYNYNEKTLLIVGERISNIARLFNIREGFKRKDDTLPLRTMDEPLPTGPSKGKLITKEELRTMLDEYYYESGWSPQGTPTKKRLKTLNLHNRV